MLISYLKTSLRSLSKNKLFTAINVLGLTISLVSCLTIFNLTITELQVDGFHQKEDRIYRLLFDERPSGRPGARVFSTSGPPAGPTLYSEFAEIQRFVRFRYSDNDIVQVGNKSFYETGVFYADSTLFDVFSFKLKYGDKRTALNNENSVLLSEELATKYFGDQDPIGQTIRFNDEKLLQVTGVLNTNSSGSHLDLRIVIPFHAFEVPAGYPVDLNEWSWASFHTYLLLEDEANKEELERKLSVFTKENLPENIADRFTFTIQPLEEVYFSAYNNDQVRSGTMGYVWSLIAIAAILLVLALLNFINLSTARLINRSQEMGLRKVLGAQKTHVSYQFLIETILIVSVSSLFSLLIYETIVREYIDSNQHFLVHLFVVLVLAIPLSLISSSFPTWNAWKVNMLSALKGEVRKGRKSSMIRKVFITLQFSIALTLITSSIVVNNQLDYIHIKDLGYDKEQLLVIETGGNVPIDRAPVFKSVFSSISGVKGISFSSSLLDGNHGNVPVRPDGYDHEEGFPMHIVAASPEWLPQLGVELIAGEFSRSQFPYNSRDLVINESALKILQKAPHEALGISMQVGEILEGNVIAVVKDFNYASTHSQILPLVIFNPSVNIEHIYVRVTSEGIDNTLEALDKEWTKISSNLPFTYRFVDEHLDSLYQKDQQFRFLIQLFTYVAIFLAMFGLYGLVSFNVSLALKQMAIRRVLGAGELKLYLSELKLYFLLILFSAVVASPVSWVLMKQWLSEFAYRVDMSLAPIIMGVLLIGIIVLITISHLIIRAVKLNPIVNLRSE